MTVEHQPEADTPAVAAAAGALGPRARRGVMLGGCTTNRVGGPAALFFEVVDESDLGRVSKAIEVSGLELLVVGRGSNLLVADEGFDGLVLTLGSGFESIEVDGTTVRVGGAVSLPVLARRTAAAGLSGLEWAVGVPGSVGGGVRMNAGGHGSDIAASLVRAWVYDVADPATGLGPLAAAELDLGYRRSGLSWSQVLTAAEFALVADDVGSAEERVANVVRWRREHQPGGANAGSVFANPPGDSAGRLIDAAGARGRRRGSAHVSPKHANFFQVDPDGSASDVLALMVEVQSLVLQHSGVLLLPEVRLVGFSPAAKASLFSGGSP